MRPSGSPGRPHGRCRWRPDVSVTLFVKAMASATGGQDGLGEGLAVGLATPTDTATDEWPPAGRAGRGAAGGVELKGGPGQRAQRNPAGNGRDLRDFHRRPHNVRTSRIGTKGAHLTVVHN